MILGMMDCDSGNSGTASALYNVFSFRLIWCCHFHCTDVFAFDMYDTDNDGILSEAQVHTMFNELLGVHHAHTAQNEL